MFNSSPYLIHVLFVKLQVNAHKYLYLDMTGIVSEKSCDLVDYKGLTVNNGCSEIIKYKIANKESNKAFFYLSLLIIRIEASNIKLEVYRLIKLKYILLLKILSTVLPLSRS